VEIQFLGLIVSRIFNKIHSPRVPLYFGQLALIAALKFCFLGGMFFSEILSSEVDEDDIAFLDKSTSSSLVNIPRDKLWSALKGETGLKKIQRHVESGGDANLLDNKGRSLLERVARTGGQLGESLTILLLTKGARVENMDADGCSAIYMASTKGHGRIVELLINELKSRNYDLRALSELLNREENKGITSLRIASERGYNDVVRILCVNGANPNKKDDEGWTSLHWASYCGHGEVVRTLLEYGASVTEESNAGFTARQYAMCKELRIPTSYSNIVHYLREKETIASLVTGKRVEEHESQRKSYINSEENLKAFYETFNGKLGAIFLSYKILHTGLLAKNVSDFSLPNCINLLGNVIPLPGASMVATGASMLAAAVEDAIEEPKIAFLATYFTTVRIIEEEIEKSAVELTYFYANKIQALTQQGASVLAECAIGRFVKYIRENRLKIIREERFFDQVLKGLRTFETHLGTFPWTDVAIETKDKDQKWTDKLIFQETDSSSNDPVKPRKSRCENCIVC